MQVSPLGQLTRLHSEEFRAAGQLSLLDDFIVPWGVVGRIGIFPTGIFILIL